MTPLPKVECPVCNREFALRKDGLLRCHYAPGLPTWCSGSAAYQENESK